MEVVDDREVWSFQRVRAEIGRMVREDGKPVARGTVYRLIEEGLPAHRLANAGRFHFYAEDVRAFVGNRWNRRTPEHDPGTVAGS